MALVSSDMVMVVVSTAATVTVIAIEWKDKAYLKRVSVLFGILNALAIWNLLTPDPYERSPIAFGTLMGLFAMLFILAVVEYQQRRSKKKSDHEPQWHYS